MTSTPAEQELPRPITMQDVRLAVGEGKLRPEDVLAGCNAELRRRLAIQPTRTEGDEGWRPISEAPKDGREIVFINKFAHCSDVVHWHAPYTKHGLEFSGRFENRSGQSTGMNDDVAWLFWTASPLPSLSAHPAPVENNT